ncbi:hypothetical protein NQ314_007153 [Rhamnusium bicolor]|uniref:Nuclease HARBI1 n=1 Tax=Rhamnusium bicolor TaxID=1586634 RepID=A0AAV8YTU7_9CUCU|nr:hypothetical protein NQ314_007153 [Rhamnusium bicolor]
MFLLTLKFYATGSMLIVVSDFIDVHKSTSSRLINNVSRAIAQLKSLYIKFPKTKEDISNVI